MFDFPSFQRINSERGEAEPVRLTVSLPAPVKSLRLSSSDGGGLQRDGGLHGGVSVCSHRHDLQGFEQSQHLPGDLFQGGAAQDGLHQQLQHVGDRSAVVALPRALVV